MKDVIVVGSGFGGLAQAALLAKDGHKVRVFEKNEQPGGRASVYSEKGYTFDMGPSWYLMPEVFEHFYRLMGSSTAEQFDLQRLDPGYRAYFEGSGDPFDLPTGREAARAAILDGRADTGLAVRAVARQYHLDFVPLVQERLDIAVLRASYFDPPMQALFAFTRRPAFQRQAKMLAGYDVTELGRVRWNG
mgnify:CR=1 FL=1